MLHCLRTLLFAPLLALQLLAQDPLAASKTCAAGSVPGVAASTCTSCAPGRFSTRPGQLRCDRCPGAKYQHKRGASFCFTSAGHCPAGTYNSVLEQSTYVFTATACAVCPAGKYGVSMSNTMASNGEDPYDSVVHQYKPDTGAHERLRLCQQCPAGKFTDVAGATACTWCRKGRQQNWVGQASCLACPRGRVAPHRGAKACTPCKAGFYQLFIGQTLCDPCEAGRASSKSGSKFCASCNAGQYGTSPAMPTCWFCPAGKFQPKSGQSKCFGVVEMTQVPTPAPNVPAFTPHAATVTSAPPPPSAQLLGMPSTATKTATPQSSAQRPSPLTPVPPAPTTPSPPPPPPPSLQHQQQQLRREPRPSIPTAVSLPPLSRTSAVAHSKSQPASTPIPPALRANITAVFVTLLLFAWGTALAAWSWSNSRVQRMEGAQQFNTSAHHQRDEDAVALVNQVLSGAKSYSATAPVSEDQAAVASTEGGEK